MEEYGGNHVVQDIGDGRFAFYAHLQPGNAEGLEVGQRLTRGDVVGRLGNSGNTDAPHLHFHVMDSPLPLASNGVPFVFDSFELQGRVTSEAIDACAGQSEPCELDTSGSGSRRDEGPLVGDVMSYRLPPPPKG